MGGVDLCRVHDRTCSPTRSIGWNLTSTLRAKALPLNMATLNAQGTLDELVHHADHGSNRLSIVYTDRVVELDAKPSTRTVGDSYDNALAEAVNGLYKTKLLHRHGPQKTAELATLEYLWWWNNTRPHQGLGHHTPTEDETTYHPGLKSTKSSFTGLTNVPS